MKSKGNKLSHYQKLSQLLPSLVEEDFLRYLQPIDAVNFSSNGQCVSFKSENIIDGWKHIHRRFWYHPMHQLSPYLGRFPPAIAKYFICKFSRVGQVVYDPFCGSGTVPLEACLLEREAVGNDIFVYAYTLSRAKVNALKRDEFDAFIQFLKSEVEACFNRITPDEEPLMQDLLVYYHPDTLQQILAVRSILNDIGNDDQKADSATFIKAMVCGILHGPTPMSLSVQTKDTWSASVRYVREYVAEHGLKYEPRDIFTCLKKKAQRIYTVPLPPMRGTIHKYNIVGDLTKNERILEDESVDLIVTSPPYLSVRDYTHDNWLRIWFLGKSREQEAKKILKTGIIADYETAMKKALQQMFRVLKQDRACVIVAADVKRGKNGSSIYRTTQSLARYHPDSCVMICCIDSPVIDAA